MKKVVYYFGNCLELMIPVEAIECCSHSGDCWDDVDFWLDQVDFSGVTGEQIKSNLYEYGCWDEEDLQDEELNRRRLLWLACGDLKENGYNEDEVEEVEEC